MKNLNEMSKAEMEQEISFAKEFVNIATYYRHNPQLSSGGYQTTRKIEAVSITSARKKAREITEGCVYGSLELLGVEKEG